MYSIVGDKKMYLYRKKEKKNVLISMEMMWSSSLRNELSHENDRSLFYYSCFQFLMF